jgi:hypothetical protein
MAKRLRKTGLLAELDRAIISADYITEGLRSLRIMTAEFEKQVFVGSKFLFNFKAQQSIILQLLANRERISTDGIIAVLYADRLECDRPINSYEVVRVAMSNIRKKLKPFGVTIETYYGSMIGGVSGGYYLKPEMKNRLKELLADRSPG